MSEERTDDPVMLKCGCAAQGVLTAIGGQKLEKPIPSCFIHDCHEPADTAPDLTGRKARCAYYGAPTSLHSGHSSNECNYGQSKAARCTCEQPSSRTLPFFEYQGAGSTEATKPCKHCGFHEVAHGGSNTRCRKFEAKGPQEIDKFYCGCHGWD